MAILCPSKPIEDSGADDVAVTAVDVLVTLDRVDSSCLNEYLVWLQ